MTHRTLPCLICGRDDHTSSSCSSPMAHALSATGLPSGSAPASQTMSTRPSARLPGRQAEGGEDVAQRIS
jgi:hypothetical protein